VWDYSRDFAASHRLFTGHFDVDFIDLVDPSGFKLTLLRDPLSRIVSMYDFWRSIDLGWANYSLTNARFNAPRFARTHTFGAFVRTNNPFVIEAIQNSAARQLLGRRFGDLAADPVNAAQAAFARLQTFDWYATTTGLSAAFPALSALLGASAPDDVHVHRTYSPEPHEPRVQVMATIPSVADQLFCMKINQIDLRLYNLATSGLAFGFSTPPGRRRSRCSQYLGLGGRG
jgi:hypothetical protein